MPTTHVTTHVIWLYNKILLLLLFWLLNRQQQNVAKSSLQLIRWTAGMEWKGTQTDKTEGKRNRCEL